MTTKRQSLKKTSSSGLWWLIPFDAVLGFLFLLLSLADMKKIWPLAPGPDASSGLITPVACLIDAGLASALLVAGFLLLRQKLAAPVQRAAAAALLLRSGLVIAELFLLNEGGIDGILRVRVLLVLTPLTLMALAAAVLLGRQERRGRPPKTPMDHPGASPTSLLP